MAPKKLFTLFFLASLFLLLLSPSCSENVTISVYYETLCPYCADFIVNHLVKLFQNGLNSIVNLRMIPWGNSMIKPDGTFACQHGPDECLLNTIEACTISIYPDVVQHFSFIHCVEGLTLEKRQAEWINCFEYTRLGKVPIDCYSNGNGKLLEQKYATETAQLQPPHRFVPWVIVNNQPLQEDFMNIITYVCKAYKGSQVPEACRSLPTNNNTPENAESNSSFCYAGDVKN
ncbi:gamma-interferon-inducible lysosomal thiol reductase-like [Melia azedarach]|uniref:Gamma-interferon-inducible lysosomal thiol reductase-like n=1 Tax=Melia azedarach TaxID=155640 RepID=A0ACC1WZ45_MELAZ|nr:gamma-interferon-inducible lysosomal thiol reductase-like [Melia azedarach]